MLTYSTIFGKKALEHLATLTLRDRYRQSLDGYISLAETLVALIEKLNDTIGWIVKTNPQATLLTTIPGISYYSTLLIVSDIGAV